MAQAFYSIVLDHTADDVWRCIRCFGDYAWSGVEAETTIEGGKAGDQVGGIRCVRLQDRVIRQQLLAHSDLARLYTYAFLEPAPVPNYVATIGVLPVVESSQAFVQWSASFDCDEAERAHWTQFFAHEGFARWLGALRAAMDADRAASPR